MSAAAAPSEGVRLLAGKCLCGSVEYAVEDNFGYALNCHCSQCRRATGAAFKPFAGIEHEKLRVMRGSEDLLIFGEELTRCDPPIERTRRLEHPDFEQLTWVIPLVDRVTDIEALGALQPDQLRAQRSGEYFLRDD